MPGDCARCPAIRLLPPLIPEPALNNRCEFFLDSPVHLECYQSLYFILNRLVRRSIVNFMYFSRLVNHRCLSKAAHSDLEFVRL
mgnify:CR=1 FL=1